MSRTCETCRFSVEEPEADDPPAYTCEVGSASAEKWQLIDAWRDYWLLDGGDGRKCHPGAGLPGCPCYERTP